MSRQTKSTKETRFISDNIIQLHEQVIKAELKDLVKQSVEETLNNLLDQEAAELINASKYERTKQRKDYPSRCCKSSIEEPLIDIYGWHLALLCRGHHRITLGHQGLSWHHQQSSTKKAYGHIEIWRNRQLPGEEYPCVFIDEIYLKRNWGGEYENVAILVAIAVNRGA